MLFVLYCLDKPGHSEVRAANRPDHLDYLLVIEAADSAGAKAFAAGDPYAKAGLFESVAIKPYKKVLP